MTDLFVHSPNILHCIDRHADFRNEDYYFQALALNADKQVFQEVFSWYLNDLSVKSPWNFNDFFCQILK